MKKIVFAAAMAVAAGVFTSCGNTTPSANLKTDIDSLSYAYGLAQTQGLKEYLAQQQGVDTTYLNDFIKGLNEGANAGDDKKRAAYYAGIQIGQQISQRMVPGINMQVFGQDSTMTISMKNYLAGFITGTRGDKGLFTIERAQQLAEDLTTAVRAKKYEPNKKKGKEYQDKFAKDPSVKKLEVNTEMAGQKYQGTLLYKELKAGTGAIPTDSSLVKLHYEGKTIDGKEFDSSYKRNQPTTMTPKQTVPGFMAALTHMPVGSKWEVVIPEELAYGANTNPGSPIEPFSTLIFTIEVLGIEK